MKFTILINQRATVEANLHDKTDLVDWAILDYIVAWQSSPKATRYQDKVWLNYKHLIEEMPLLRLRSKQSVSNRIKKLRELNLLDTHQAEDKRLFVATSELYFNITQFRRKTPRNNSEGVPEKGQEENIGVPQKGQGVPEMGQGVPEMGQGVPQEGQGVPEKGHSTNHQNNPSEQTIKTTTVENKKGVVVLSELMKKKEIKSAMEWALKSDYWKTLTLDKDKFTKVYLKDGSELRKQYEASKTMPSKPSKKDVELFAKVGESWESAEARLLNNRTNRKEKATAN